jgi:hypothetical protein
MQSQDFTDFVVSQQADPPESPSAAKARSNKLREEWLQSLDDLYRRILTYLDEFLKQELISYSYKPITLHETRLGRYKAKRMEIAIGKQLVTVEPIGTMLIGSRGRVDVRGAAGQRQLLYVKKDASSAMDLITVSATIGKAAPSSPKKKEPVSYAWKIVSRDRQATFVDLGKDSFYGLLMEVAGGG